MERARTKMHQITSKKYYPHMLSVFIPAIICIIVLIGNFVYPLGENCILHVDMYHQYLPFFQEFRNKLLHGGSMMYSWNLGLGSDFVSLYVYYLASPLNLLVAFCPEKHVIEFMTVLIVLKICLSSLGCFLFLKERYSSLRQISKFARKGDLYAVLLGTTYALCGFVAAYSWDIMWMDCIALFPFIMLGLYRLVTQNKVGLYYGTLALAIWSNYYIAMMICMFLVLYFCYLWVKQKKGKARAFMQFSVYSILAGGTSAVLLIPEYMVLSYSGSSGIHFPQAAKWYFNAVQGISRMALGAYTYTGKEHWPNLYTGAFAVLFLVLYFLNRKISWKDKLAKGVLVVFFFVSFGNNMLDFIWHGFHFPDSLPGRQSFLFSFLVVCMCYEVILRWEQTRIWQIVVAIVLTVPLFIWGYVQVEDTLFDTWALALMLIFMLCYTCIMILAKLADIQLQSLLRKIIMALVLTELIANTAITGFGVTDRTSYMAKYDDYEYLLEEITKREEDVAFYRVEDMERNTKNDAMFYGYAGATQFSSLMNINVSHFYQELGMEGGKNFYCYNGATPIIASLLCMKYRIADNGMEESRIWKPIAGSGKSFLYENIYALPLGVLMDKAEVEAYEASTGYRYNHVNDFTNALGCGNLLQKVDCSQAKEPGSNTLMPSEPGYYFASYLSTNAETLRMSTSNGKERKYAKASHGYLLDLGEVDYGETITIHNDVSEELTLTIYRLNEAVLANAYEKLQQNTMQLLEKTDTRIVGEVQLSYPQILVLTIPSVKGWTLKIDGKQAKIREFEETMIAAELDTGEHTIELTYETPGLRIGAAISGVCLLLFGISIIIHRARRKKMRVMEIKGSDWEQLLQEEFEMRDEENRETGE